MAIFTTVRFYFEMLSFKKCLALVSIFCFSYSMLFILLYVQRKPLISAALHTPSVLEVRFWEIQGVGGLLVEEQQEYIIFSRIPSMQEAGIT